MKDQKRENIFVSAIFNVVIPILILKKLSSPEQLGQLYSLILAVLFPLSYGIWDIAKNRKVNKIAILGLINIFLTGVVGILKLDPQLIAIKEAAVPGLIGLFVLVTAKTKNPLTKMFIMNDMIFQIDKIEARLKETNNEALFKKKLYNSTFLLALSFLVSSILNYVLAKVIVVSPSGTEAFNKELGEMLMYSYPVIVVPSMIIMGITLWYVISNLTKLTGYKLDELMVDTKKDKKKNIEKENIEKPNVGEKDE